jgi:ornithine cyclodeaminase/alanine dehydrogenase-like protein (mu-crystallin family)
MDMKEGDMLLMPACLDDSVLCVKAVLTYPGNRDRNLPVVQGALMVFDPATGTPQALMDCEELTAIRTGAVGGLAIDLLSRQDSHTLGVIGAGVQGRMQVQAAMAVRKIRQIRVFDMCHESAVSLRDEVSKHADAPAVIIASDSEDAVQCADIVITATTSPTPTFDGRHLRPGTHVNACGSYRPERREVDTFTVERAYVVADWREACMTEAGDLIIPERQPDAELGEVVNGTAAGRTDDQQITFFKSVGLAVQDAAAAGWVLKQAEQRGVGALIDV